MIIAIDFDGTIVGHKYPEIGTPILDAKNIINKLYDEGHVIIIWTCRTAFASKNRMENYLINNNINYDHVNENYSELDFTPWPKIYADMYVDDRQAGGLPSWVKIYELVQEKIRREEVFGYAISRQAIDIDVSRED